MTARIPIRFQDFGSGAVATVDFSLHLWRPRRELQAFALVDTGSTVTVFPEALLRRWNWPVDRARHDDEGLRGIGGTAAVRYVENGVFGLVDQESALQVVNLRRVYFTKALFPSILGCDVMRALNAELHLDFVDHVGHLELG